MRVSQPLMTSTVREGRLIQVANMVRCLGMDDGVRCIHKKSRYNFDGLPARYCLKHKTDGMIDVKSKRCRGKEDDGTRCTKRAGFNVEGGSAIYCGRHKTPDTVRDILLWDTSTST